MQRRPLHRLRRSLSRSGTAADDRLLLCLPQPAAPASETRSGAPAGL